MTRPQKVTATSISAFHTNADSIRSQRQAVAEFILQETKAGRWTWISKIAANAEKIGHIGLSQKSSAGRALNELKKHGAVINGEAYVLLKAGVRWPAPGSNRSVEQWAMVLKSSQK